MDYTERIKGGINNCLTETHLNDGTKKTGKVRDKYILDDKIVMITTDRQSAFDRMLASIPYKGQVLNQTSAWWFDKTRHIVGNHILEVADPNTMVVKKCTVFPIEFIMRGFMTGSTNTSVWTNYQQGSRVFCGNILPEGMKKNQKFNVPIITPTTKSESDSNISPEEIVKQGLMSLEDWKYCSQKALELFRFGQATAMQNGLILVDTKYEFGKDAEGNILLIDEIHTPDSSRYWIAESFEERFDNGQEPENIDKEFLRLWFKEHCDPYKDKDLPDAPEELVTELSRRYIQLYEMITGKQFEFPNQDEPIMNRIKNNLSSHLNSTVKKVSPENGLGITTTEKQLNSSEEISYSHKEVEQSPASDLTKCEQKAVIIMGSVKDKGHVKQITDKLDELNILHEQHVASAHKQAVELLQILEKYKNSSVIYITIAGRSNALSGFVAGNSDKIVLACPPFVDKLDMMVNVNSTLQMPSNVPVLTILDPKNTALAVKRIIKS